MLLPGRHPIVFLSVLSFVALEHRRNHGLWKLWHLQLNWRTVMLIKMKEWWHCGTVAVGATPSSSSCLSDTHLFGVLTNGGRKPFEVSQREVSVVLVWMLSRSLQKFGNWRYVQLRACGRFMQIKTTYERYGDAVSVSRHRCFFNRNTINAINFDWLLITTKPSLTKGTLTIMKVIAALVLTASSVSAFAPVAFGTRCTS